MEVFIYTLQYLNEKNIFNKILIIAISLNSFIDTLKILTR